MPVHTFDAKVTQLLADALTCLAVRFITIEKAAQTTGYTAAAIRSKKSETEFGQKTRCG
jgi:hypothetical protein